MTVTIGSATLQHLQAQPLGYDESTVVGGITARQWVIQGLVTGSEWVSLLGVYDTWRNAKIAEPPAEISKALGTTVAFSGTGYGSQAWTNVPCWFNAAPSGSQVNSLVSVSFGIVDANQALQVLLKQIENENAQAEEINYGTITLGGVVITLLDDPDVFVDTPTLELTAGNKHYVTGPQVVTEGKNIRGRIIATDKEALRLWYKTLAESSPVAGQYFPISPPSFTGVTKIVSNVPVLYYEVSMSVVLVV